MNTADGIDAFDHSPQDLPADQPVGTRPARLALIELLDRDGRVARTVDVVAWPLTIGRALDNDIVLDDPHVAAHHARIGAPTDGTLTLDVLASRNGVDHDGKRYGSGQPLPLPDAGATLQLGATRLRVRLPGETLSAERLLPGIVRGDRARLAAMALALWLLVLAGQWISLDPGTDTSAWLPVVLGVPLALAAWCGVWALMSKLFQHRFDFGGHLRIAVPWLLALTLAEQLWPQVAAALDWPWMWQWSGAVQALLAALLVRDHLAHVLPQHHRAVTAVVAAVTLAGGAVSLSLTWRANDSPHGAPYMSTLPLPALRLSGSAPVDALVQDMAPLSSKLQQRAKKAREEDDADGGDGAADAGDGNDE